MCFDAFVTIYWKIRSCFRSQWSRANCIGLRIYLLQFWFARWVTRSILVQKSWIMKIAQFHWSRDAETEEYERFEIMEEREEKEKNKNI